MTLSALDLLALFCVVFIGLPHGAFDGALYALLPQQKRARSLAVFLVIYSLITLAIIAIWYWLPLASLAAFLAISAFHFGKGDTEIYYGKARLIALICHGGLVTVYLPVIHQQQAFVFFAILTGATAGELELLHLILQSGAVMWLASCLAYLLMAVRNAHYRVRFGELLLAMIVMWALPLLPAFAFYFCLIHSRRHFLSLYQAAHQAQQTKLLPLAAGLTIASWTAGAIALYGAMQYQSFVLSAIQIIFIGLAALTVPHMILVDGLWHPYTGTKQRET